MKFIKTEYGEWYNPALIKHFNAKPTNSRNAYQKSSEAACEWLDEYMVHLNSELAQEGTQGGARDENPAT